MRLDQAESTEVRALGDRDTHPDITQSVGVQQRAHHALPSTTAGSEEPRRHHIKIPGDSAEARELLQYEPFGPAERKIRMHGRGVMGLGGTPCDRTPAGSGGHPCNHETTVNTQIVEALILLGENYYSEATLHGRWRCRFRW
jgi:hypothetical protein